MSDKLNIVDIVTLNLASLPSQVRVVESLDGGDGIPSNYQGINWC